MEFLGGFMIMLILLGLFFAAIWISLPFLLLGLRHRIEESLITLVRLEGRIARLEQQIKHDHDPVSQTTEGADMVSGGVDGTAGR